jgi:type VI protein secretion system component VasF
MDVGEWFGALLGAVVLIATYVFFGKRLVDQVKSLRAELEKPE